MNKYSRCTVATIFLILGISKTYSQNSTNSPYTYYGIGEFVNSDHSRTSGMGGIGIGIKSKGFINYQNPSSYSAFDSLNVILDVAFSGSLSKIESSNGSNNTINGNLKKFAFGFRLSPKWAISAGLVPFTNIGYKTVTKKGIEGLSDNFNITSEGKGGLSKVFIGNSLKLGNNISIGFNTNLLIGYYEKNETYTFDEYSTDYKETIRKYKPSSTFTMDFGLQYTDTINSKWGYTVGFTGGTNTKLRMREYVNYNSESSTEDELTNSYNFWTPAFIGLGFSINSQNWTFGADYKIQYWENLINKNGINYLNNSHHLAFGAEYTPKGIFGRTILQRMSYQIGGHFDRSYLKINSMNFDTYGFSAGVLIPIKNQGSRIGVSFDMGKKGRVDNGMFKENYYQLNLSLNFSDFWFQKRRFN